MLIAIYTERLQDSLGPVNARALAAAVAREKPADTLAWLQARNVSLLGDRSVRVLNNLYVEAAWLGACVARAQIGNLSKAAAATLEVDWAGWKPGDVDAARNLMADEFGNGLKELQAQAGIVMQGIDATRMDALSNALSDAVLGGFSQSATAALIKDKVGGTSKWANVVANTETRRAVTAATLDTYAAAGIEGKEWSTAGNAVDECKDYEDAGPIPLDGMWGDVSGPPAHPNCLCVVLPVLAAATPAEPGDELETEFIEPELIEPEPEPVVVGPTDVEIAAQEAASKALLEGRAPTWLPSEQVLGTQTAGPAGSNVGNPGGFWTGEDGVKRYVKAYANPEQAWSEMLANTLYERAGATVPKTSLSTYIDPITGHEKTLLVTEIIDNQGTVGSIGMTDIHAASIADNFATDLWLANYDAVGTGLDNIVVTASGDVARIDSGGSMLFRAQGALKESDPSKLWQTNAQGFFTNPYYKKVFQKLGYSSPSDISDLPAQVKSLRKMVEKAGGVEKLVDDLLMEIKVTSGGRIGLATAERQTYVDLLEQRLQSLEGQHPVLPPNAPAVALPTPSPIIGHAAYSHGAGAAAFDGQEGPEWGRRVFADWRRNLTPGQRTALARYSTSEYTNFNRAFRNPRDPYISADTKLQNKRIRAGLRTAIVPENVIVNRGITIDGSVLDAYRAIKTGEVIYDPAVQSTSVAGRAAFDGNVMLRIRVPAGSQGGYLDTVSHHSGEKELLLQAGSALRVDAKHFTNDGKMLVDVTIISQTPGAIPPGYAAIVVKMLRALLRKGSK